jgi:hypothetical protein
VTLPTEPGRLASIKDFVQWRRAVERILGQYDARISARRDTGTAVIYLGTGTPPAGLLVANGTTVAQDDYPDLYARLGTTYNTGGEPAGTFRLPNPGAAPFGVWCVRT